MINITINLQSEIEKHFSYLYDYFPPDVVPKIIEQDVNTMLNMYLDDSKCTEPIQHANHREWQISLNIVV